jgi:hypothetical protein
VSALPLGSDPAHVSMDPAAISACAGCLRDGAQALRDASRTVAPVADAPGLPDDLRATLTTLRTALDGLAGELAEHGDDLGSCTDGDAGALTSLARVVFGADAWTAGSEPQSVDPPDALVDATADGAPAATHGALIEAASREGVRAIVGEPQGTTVALPVDEAAAYGFGVGITGSGAALNGNLANLFAADYVTRKAGPGVRATPSFTDFSAEG